MYSTSNCSDKYSSHLESQGMLFCVLWDSTSQRGTNGINLKICQYLSWLAFVIISVLLWVILSYHQIMSHLSCQRNLHLVRRSRDLCLDYWGLMLLSALVWECERSRRYWECQSASFTITIRIQHPNQHCESVNL